MLKARFGAHEVIVTIMLNFIVLALLNWIVAAHLHVPETLHTPEMQRRRAAAAHRTVIPAFHGSAANCTLCCSRSRRRARLVGILFRTRARLRAARGRTAAGRRGVRRRARRRACGCGRSSLSGALAGLGGINYVLGYKHYYEEGFAGGAGFLGIAVALVGRNHPFGVVLAALLFATLSQGGLAIHALVPKQMVEVLQGVVILAVAAAVPEVRRLRARRARERAGMSEIVAFLAQTLRIAIPYLFAASGGVVAERAGVVSLTLEGFMLTGAFAATLGSYYSGSPWIGVLCGIGGGLLFGLIHAVASIRYRADQIVRHRDQSARGRAHALLPATGVRQLVELAARVRVWHRR